MKFGSVCSGIEAASVAWHPLGWRAAWLAEIEPFPSAVLAHHYPDVPNLGDMSRLPERILSGEVEAPDVFCGGTPCQAFSVAGLRKSLDDARGNLSLTFCEIANEIDAARSIRGEQPAIVFWENVPGVLNTSDNAFGCFLAGLAGEELALLPPGGKWTNAGCVLGPKRAVAWRVLDAQYFGVAQRRRRVFVVASAREGFDPAAVLFEWDSLRRDTAPSREAGEATAAGAAAGLDVSCTGTLTAGFGKLGAPEVDAYTAIPVHHAEITSALCAADGPKGVSDQYAHEGKLIAMSSGQANAEITFDHAAALTCLHEAPIVTHSLRGEGFDASEDSTGRGTPLVPVAFDTTQITSAANYSNPQPGDPCHPLAAGAHAPAIAFPANLSGTQCAAAENLAPSMGAKNPTAVCFAIQAGALRTNPASGPDGVGVQSDHAYTLEARAEVQAVAQPINIYGGNKHADRPDGGFYVRTDEDTSKTLDASTGLNPTCSQGGTAVIQAMQVRRLTPVECERLQGFPDGYTAIPWRGKPADQCPDGPRYKALGNSWAVPVVRWIGGRIMEAIK